MVTKFSLLSFLLIAFGAFSETSASTPDTRNLAVIKTGESIAFLGDSITAGGGNHGGYCRLVVHGLKTKGIRVNGIYAGISRSPFVRGNSPAILWKPWDAIATSSIFKC
jgi:hypothetical protein